MEDNIKINDFIQQIFSQIIEGVEKTNEQLKESDAFIPAYVLDENGSELKQRNIVNVNFDIALTISKTDNNEIGGGVVVASLLKIGGQNEISNAEQIISRVKFDLPLVLPECTKSIVIKKSGIEIVMK